MVKLLKIIPSRTGGPDLAMLPDGRLVPLARTEYEKWRFAMLYGGCVYSPKVLEWNAKQSVI